MQPPKTHAKVADAKNDGDIPSERCSLRYQKAMM